MGKIEAVYNACNPLLPLAAGDPRYVACDEARGGEDLIEIFARRIRRSEKPLCQLFAGHLGGGKSTELLRLKAELESAKDGEKYLVVYFEADEEDIDTNDVEFSDVLLAVIKQLARQLHEKGIALRAGWFGGFWEEIKSLLKAPVELDKLELSAGFAKLTAVIKNSPDSRHKIRQAIEPRLSSLIEEANQLLSDVLERIRSRGYRELVVVVDNLDRVTLRTVGEKTDTTTHDLLFIERADQLQSLRCHIVYTVPISLTYGQRAGVLLSRYPNIGPRLPMVKIVDPKGRKFRPGMNIMRQILARRFQSVGVKFEEVFRDQRLADKVIHLSGGHPRHLLTLFRFVCDRVEDLPLTKEAVERAIQVFANTWTVPEDHWPLLPGIHRSKRIRNDLMHQMMLYNLVVLEYLDGEEPWYDVHPAVRHLKRFRETLGGKRKTQSRR